MGEIDWVLLGRYAAGECTEAERAAVEGWLACSSTGRDALRAIDRVAAQTDQASSPEHQQIRFARLQARLETAPPRRPAAWWRPAMKIAAGLTLLLGASSLAFITLRRPVTPAAPDATMHTIATAPGQRMSLRLSDGTEVQLGPASTFRFPASFGVRNRIVELDGEAVFTVTHDEHRPFAVRTSRFEARDLGTRFVVQAYTEDSLGQVAVVEGQVAVARGASTDSVILSPGDGARIARVGAVTVMHEVALDTYFGWTEGHLVFRRATLGEALRKIERWHDVEIDLASAVPANRRFSASFAHGESAAEMLQVIGAVLNLDVRQTDRRRFALAAVR